MKIMRAFLWAVIVSLEVGLGLWAAQAWSQEQPQRPPTLNEMQGSLQVVTMQRDFAQQQAQSAAAQAMEMAAQLKAAKDELARLKPKEEPKK